MAIKTIIKKNTYFDSVTLMTLSTKANNIPGIQQVNISMGTTMNKEVLRSVGLYSSEADEAKPGDMMIVYQFEDGFDPESLENDILDLMVRKDDGEHSSEQIFSSLEMASKVNPDAGIAVVSVPGTYAARVAKKALSEGLHVMIFSDNVTIEDEIALKTEAHEKGLLVMGPDCGTSIIGGKGLCFANEVRKGRIGIVAASGTGAQEVSVRVHDFGGGISHLIGTGGRDLSKEVGGIMMLDGLNALMNDDGTDVIILVSKPPSDVVTKKIYAKVAESNKPVIICFIGGDQHEIEASGAIYAKTTKQAALKAVILSGVPEASINKRSLNLPLIDEIRAKLTPSQKYIRGLFCGGTICDEVAHLVKEEFDNVYTNISKDPKYKLTDINISREHTLIDFGDDAFTQGKPHPMIDPSLRNERFLKEAADPEVGVLVIDIVLGYGSHPDPIGVTLPVIKKAKEMAANEGRHLEILAFVLGTERDPQEFADQVARLSAEGVTISSSCENTGLLSRGFVKKEA